jgi:myo-inositol 2-dehydrogenase / D-chiro-inositol 1-dehydrogenase
VSPTAATVPMRFGLVGYGLWGPLVARAIRDAPGAALAAVACRSEETARKARAEHPGIPVDLGYRPLITRPDLDAVAVVVPNDLHAEIGVAALEAGKDVLLEKPMANTPAECDRLLDAAHRTGRVLSIGHQLRLSHQWGRVKTIIDAGEIGELLHAHVSLFRFPFRPGSEGWRYAQPRIVSWMLEEAVHAFDNVMWYFERVGDPVSVFATANGRDVPPGAAGLRHNVTAVVKFPGDCHAVITETLAGFEYHQTTEITGTEGAIRTWWSGDQDRTNLPRFDLRVQRRGEARSETISIERSGEVIELGAQIVATIAAFRARRALVTGEEARKRIVVCEAAERSIREGREIPLTF